MTRAMGTLSTQGWITNPKEILDRVLSNYRESNPSQTTLFRTRVVSFQSAMFKAGNNIDVLVSYIKSDLSTVLERYFPEGCNLEVSYRLNVDTEKNSQYYTIIISAQVVSDGVSYDLSQAINDISSTYVAVTDAIKTYTI